MALERHDLLTKASVPEHGKPETGYPTPNKGDMVVIERVPIAPKKYRPLPYGSPHPDYDNNGLFLVWQGKVRAENNQVSVLRVYANDLVSNEDWYNASIKYSGDVVAVPIYVRNYVELRSNYIAKDKGAALTDVIRLRVLTGGTYTSQPTVTITPVGAGVAPTARAIMNPAGTKVIGLELLTAGSALVLNPTVAFSGGGQTVAATATAEIQPVTALLVHEETTKLDSEDKQMASLFIKVHRVYEVLPGPWLPKTRYDNDLGPIQIYMRAVLNIGQIGGTITATGKHNYESRDGSAIVLWEILEAWSNGSGTPGPFPFPGPGPTPDPNPNDPYPILILDDYERRGEGRGAYQRTSQIVVKVGTEAGQLTRAAGVVTKITYEPYGENPFLLKKIVETWVELIINDKRVTNQFGGAILSHKETTDDPGVQSVETGFLVVSSVLEQTSPDEQKLTTEKFDPSSAVPVLELLIGGSGYGPTAPSVTLVGGVGGGGTAHSILGFPVVSVAVSAGGGNFSTPPAVHFINAIGGGGLAIAVLGFGVASAVVTNPGNEYTVALGAPVVTFSPPPSGLTALGTAIVGYGVYFATITDPGGRAVGTLTSNNTNVSDGHTVTIGTKVYTFRTALTPTEGEVLIGASADASLLNLIRAINHTGTPNVDYKCAVAHPTVTAAPAVTARAFAVTAISPGIGGNAIATTETAPGAILSWGAVTLTGGFSYTEIPRAIIEGGAGTGALGYLIMGSPINAISITDHGTGYIAGNPPIISVVFGVGDGLTTTVGLGFSIASITASVIGSGYVQETTTVTIGPPEPGGIQATADPIVTINGPVDTVTIDSGGNADYTSAPTPNFSAGAGSGATGTSTLGYEVASVALLTPGTGYTSFPSFSISGGGGTGAAIQLKMAMESITAIISGGTGYAVNDILDVVGGAHTTVAQIRVTTVSSGAVTAVSLETAGLYTTLTANPHSVTGGTGGTTTDTLAYVSTGDANGLFYWIGSNFGGTWTNPHSAGRVTFSKSVTPFSTDPISALCDRATSYVSNDNVNGDWIGVDIGTGRTLVIDEYIMQNGSQSPYNNAPANWNLEGSNNVASPFAVANFDAATWASIDVRTSDTTIAQSLGAWGHFTANQSNTTPYRFFRIKTTGLNQTATLYFLQVGEIEFYGSFFRPVPASGATFTLKWLVSQIALTGNGNGYITAPPITISGGGAGTQATASATLDATGSVKLVTVTAGGTGYTGDFAVTFTSGGGTGATATAHVTSGAVTGYTMTNFGTGYVDTPPVTINSPGGTSAVGTAVKTTTNGGVWRISVINGGIWELPAPTLSVFGGDGTGATAVAALDLDTLFVHRLHVVLPGHAYTTDPVVRFVYLDGSTPLGLAATTTRLTTGGEVVGVSIGTFGTGYLTEPTITFSYGSAAATAVLARVGKVVSVNVLVGGLYRTTPVVEFVSVDGSGAIATATIDTTNGSVVDLVLDTPGTYTVAPTVVFGGTPTVAATGIYHIGTTEWPANPSFDTDDVTGIVVLSIEKVVPTGTPYPGRSGYRGPFISQKVYDQWKTYQVTKRVDLNTLPEPEAWYSTYPFYLPPRLISIEALWSDTVSKSADATPDSSTSKGSVSVSVASGSSGGLLVKSYPAFRGRANCIIARNYFYGQVPGSMWAQLIPIKITGASGSVVLIQTSSNTFRSRANGLTGSTSLGQFGASSFEAGRIGDAFQKQVHSLDIDNHLIGNYEVIGLEHTSPPVTSYGQAGSNQLTIVAAGTPCSMGIRLPYSSPTPEYLYPGRTILVEAEPREWKFGVWVLERIYVIVPPAVLP